MEAFLCPDCELPHDEPGEATLGHRVRCLDCCLEVELTAEIRLLPPAAVAA